MRDIGNRELKIGDLVIFSFKTLSVGIIVGEGVVYSGSGIKKIDTVYLISNPDKEDIKIKNQLSLRYQELQQKRLEAQRLRREKKFTNGEKPVLGSVYKYKDEYWIYLGICKYCRKDSVTKGVSGHTYFNLGYVIYDFQCNYYDKIHFLGELIESVGNYRYKLLNNSIYLVDSHDILIYKNYSSKFMDYKGKVNLRYKAGDKIFISSPSYINYYLDYTLTFM